MHGAVLQNKKYIKFAEENTVEVLSLSALDKAIAAGDRKAETYTEKGSDTEYMVSWPGLTASDINTLRSSKASTYNKSGGIPYTSIVNPHTLAEMNAFKGGMSAKQLMEAIEAEKSKLEDEYGKSTSRKLLRKIKDGEADARAAVEEGKISEAMKEHAKIEKLVAKQSDALKQRAAKLSEEILAAAGKMLDEAEAVLARGETKAAQKTLRSLQRALKGTALEERCNALMEKTKTAG